MNKTIRSTFVTTIILALLFSIMATVTAEDPDYGTITLDPAEPVRQTEVDFSVIITGDNIDEVYCRVQECYDTETGEACNPLVLNISMSLDPTTNDTWVGSGTLNWELATIGHCWLEIKSNGSWYDFAPNKLNIVTDFTIKESENGDNGENGGNGNGGNGNGGNGSNDTPGFELLILVISIIVAISIYNKKRMR
jgi:hypothetical protein